MALCTNIQAAIDVRYNEDILPSNPHRNTNYPRELSFLLLQVCLNMVISNLDLMP